MIKRIEAKVNSILDSMECREVFLSYLWASFVYDPARKKLLELGGPLQQQPLKTSSNAIRYAPDRTVTLANEGKQSTGSEEEKEQYLLGLGLPPKLNRLGLAYQIVSTSMNVFLFLQTLLILVLDSSGSSSIGRFLICYGPRVVIHHRVAHSLVPLLTLIVTFNHIFWRTLIVAAERIRMGGSKIGLNKKLDILDRSLFFKLENGLTGETKFGLRPNRSLRARQKMIQVIKFAFSYALMASGLFFVFASPVYIYTGTLMQHVVYEKCHTQMGPGVHVLRAIISLSTTLMFYVDSCVAISIVSGGGFIFALDLMIYWNEVRNKVHRLYQYMIQARDSRQQLDEHGSRYKLKFRIPDEVAGKRLTVSVPSTEGRKMGEDYDIATREVQCMLADFFCQLGHVDKYISVLVPVAMGVWLGCNFAVTVCKFQFELNAQYQVFYLRATQMIGCISLLGLGTLVLHLKRNTEPLYLVLCNIVAMDNRINKRLWLRLLDVYTSRPRYAFTMWHGPIFTRLAFIRILSYTVTLIVLLNSYSSFW